MRMLGGTTRLAHHSRGGDTLASDRLMWKLLFLASPLRRLEVGLEEVDDEIWAPCFHCVLLPRFDEREYIPHN